jgi:hypothetical protein
MKTRVYLIVSSDGSIQTRKNLPAVAGGEVAFQLKIEIPDSAFRRTVADVDIVVTENSIVVPVPVVEVSEANVK